MALTKIDPKKVFKTVSLQDPAIDREATGEEKMGEFENSYDMSLLKFKEGEHPTIFHIRNLVSSDEARIKQAHQIVEFPDLDPEKLKGSDLKKIRPKIMQKDQQEMMIKYFNSAVSAYEENGKVESCNADLFPFSIVQEIGSLVMLRTELGDDLKNFLGS